MASNGTTLDTLALERHVLHEVDTELRDLFAARLIKHALAERGIIVPREGSGAYKLLLNRVASAEIPLDAGRTVDAIVSELEDIRETGLIRSRVETYAVTEEIDPRRMTARVKDAMVAYLKELGVQLDDNDRFNDGGYDEYLAMAYANAVRTAGGSADPIIAARLKMTAEPWDFTVRFYDDAESQGVIREFILAAAAVDYVFHVGEVVGAFALAEHVVALWENGVIGVDEATETKIFNYQENAVQRGTPERRALTYKRVLNLGNARTMTGVVVNEEFPRLWHRMMSEVARFIDKRESQHNGGRVSRQPIIRALVDLQFNLSEFGSGGTAKTAQKLNAQLEDAMDILAAPEVVEQLALGRRKSVWRVIERLHKEMHGRQVNVTAVRTLAEEGNRVFTFIANYDSTTPEDEFDAFLDSAEAWILAEAAMMEGRTADADTGEDEPEPAMADEDEEPVESAADDDWD